ncbi:MAG: hypothetical protein RMY34_22535 [Aulosira sp. DedQUE10]|nr:hypothetical protein [Aulosira sp. DedQUE10]
MKNKQGIQLAFNIRHQNGQQFMTFARIFIANGIDKIYTLSNESALPLTPLFKAGLFHSLKGANLQGSQVKKSGD